MSEVIAANLRRLMQQRSWQQRDLAGAAGLSEASVCRIMSGRQDNPTINTLQALAQALHVQISDLVDAPQAEGKQGDLEGDLLALCQLLPREELLKVLEYAEAIVAKRQRDSRLQRRQLHVAETYSASMVGVEPSLSRKSSATPTSQRPGEAESEASEPSEIIRIGF